jgi:hypothetical protein
MALKAPRATFRTSMARRVLVAAIGTLAVVALAGCVPTPDATKSPTDAVAPTATPSPSATKGPTSTPSPAAGTPYTVDCNALISRQTIYDFNPNFSLKTGYTASAGTDASKAVGFKGLVCGWINQTSSDMITVSVAHPAAADLVTLKSSAGAGTAVTGVGDSAWFATKSGIGEIQIFHGPYWITVASVAFAAPADVQTLAASVVAGAK